MTWFVRLSQGRNSEEGCWSTNSPLNTRNITSGWIYCEEGPHLEARSCFCHWIIFRKPNCKELGFVCVWKRGLNYPAAGYLDVFRAGRHETNQQDGGSRADVGVGEKRTDLDNNQLTRKEVSMSRHVMFPACRWLRKQLLPRRSRDTSLCCKPGRGRLWDGGVQLAWRRLPDTCAPSTFSRGPSRLTTELPRWPACTCHRLYLDAHPLPIALASCHTKHLHHHDTTSLVPSISPTPFRRLHDSASKLWAAEVENIRDRHKFPPSAMAAAAEPRQLGDAIVAFSLERVFPEDDSSLLPVSDIDLEPAIRALTGAKADLEVCIIYPADAMCTI